MVVSNIVRDAKGYVFRCCLDFSTEGHQWFDIKFDADNKTFPYQLIYMDRRRLSEWYTHTCCVSTEYVLKFLSVLCAFVSEWNDEYYVFALDGYMYRIRCPSLDLKLDMWNKSPDNIDDFIEFLNDVFLENIPIEKLGI